MFLPLHLLFVLGEPAALKTSIRLLQLLPPCSHDRGVAPSSIGLFPRFGGIAIYAVLISLNSRLPHLVHAVTTRRTWTPALDLLIAVRAIGLTTTLAEQDFDLIVTHLCGEVDDLSVENEEG